MYIRCNTQVRLFQSIFGKHLQNIYVSGEIQNFKYHPMFNPIFRNKKVMIFEHMLFKYYDGKVYWFSKIISKMVDENEWSCKIETLSEVDFKMLMEN